MERITSRLVRVLIITLLSAATLATAGSLTLKAQGAGPIPRMPGCDQWFALRRQNSPGAWTFLGACSQELAARGQAIENQYPWTEDLRKLLPNAQAQRGFDIGMGVAEDNTQNGPGKDALREALSAAEQGGYTVAVARSLQWNLETPRRLAELEAKGAELTSQDPAASVILNQQRDDSARRGFKIGMAAAEGNTEPGPRKDGIRASLKPEEREGFTYAVLYSLNKNRNPANNGNVAGMGGADMVTGDSSAANGADVARSPVADLGNRAPTRPIVPRGNDSRNLSATLESLRHAREYLETANPDADGHLEKAIEYTNKAIEELRKAMGGSH